MGTHLVVFVQLLMYVAASLQDSFFNQFPVVRLLGTSAVSLQADSKDLLANGNSD